MSHDLNLEEGTASQVSGELRCSSRELTKSYFGTVTKFLNSIGGRPSHSFILLWYMSSMLLDPLFLYIPVIKEHEKCYELDVSSGILAILYGSCIDCIYLTNFIWNMNHSPQHSKHKLRLIFLIDLIILLPLPQVLVILVNFQRISATYLFDGMTLFLFHHALKIIRMYTLFQKAKTEDNLAGWARCAFNLSYLHAGNVFGAMWYFFALKKQIDCWSKACINNTECNLPEDFYCNEIPRNYTISDDLCSTSTETHYTRTYGFGIFQDAIQSGVVENSDFLSRAFRCFRWGLQTVSWFGQGLPFSDDPLENIFAMSVTISGVVLFFFLIGQVQIYVQSETVKLEERKHKLQELEQWQPFEKLPKELQRQVKKYRSEKWRETRRVDVEYVANHLSEDLIRDIKRKLCLDLLKKVNTFGEWSDASLEDLCDLAKPVFYRDRSYIVREGHTIDQMLFVLQGKLWTYTSRITTESSRTDHQNSTRIHPEDNDICGIELVEWAQADASPNLPVSTRTTQALTNVEAFVLMADDLKTGLRLIIEKDTAARRI